MARLGGSCAAERRRTAKQRKFAQRQALIDEQLRQAEAKVPRTGALYKVIKTFKRGRPSERVQLRDEQGRFLTATEERKALEDYSRELFGKGEDFQLDGASGELGITSSEVVEQLRSIKLGKAVPKNCPPIVAWRAIGPVAQQNVALLLNGEAQASRMAPSSSISWLPKPPKKPDKPASLRPIGVIAPEGKILAGFVRQRLKPALKAGWTRQ